MPNIKSGKRGTLWSLWDLIFKSLKDKSCNSASSQIKKVRKCGMKEKNMHSYGVTFLEREVPPSL